MNGGSISAQGKLPVTAGALLSPRNLIERFRPRFAVGPDRAAAGIAGSKILSWPGTRIPQPLGRLGSLEVRLAASASEIRRAQALRYRVFHEEMDAVASFRARSTRRDVDRFDRICDHVVVIDHAARAHARQGSGPAIVATYRLLRHDVAERGSGFYSAGEFDIAPLLARNPDFQFLELGRSCVLAPYRNKRALELLWRGVWAYVRMHGADVMIGCASFAGTDPERLALPLSFLHYFARASGDWDVRAHAARRVEMNRLPPEAIDRKSALRSLPPLVKGYLRLGAMVGDGAVIDRQFGTTDVLMVLPVAAIAARYVEHFGGDAGRYALSSPRPASDRPRAAA